MVFVCTLHILVAIKKPQIAAKDSNIGSRKDQSNGTTKSGGP